MGTRYASMFQANILHGTFVSAQFCVSYDLCKLLEFHGTGNSYVGHMTQPINNHPSYGFGGRVKWYLDELNPERPQ